MTEDKLQTQSFPGKLRRDLRRGRESERERERERERGERLNKDYRGIERVAQFDW